ncbi:hypothetical protein [Jiangella mangrovi]|uniref:DUF1648 domain-containing protein n=1 Tax=Jiangella mangrovi TaxID=1524084 RepID=A0A7W9GUP1_9ACTN|nr:hypothetical protein [Jiangella mangrovi]MBB5790369.1 hypothetical protein [Jiangella mangrovi]
MTGVPGSLVGVVLSCSTQGDDAVIHRSRDASPRIRPSSAMMAATTATLLVGTTTVLAVRPRLPDPIATRWGPDGAEGFESLTTTLWLTAGLVAGLGALFSVLLTRAAPLGAHHLTGILVGVVTAVGSGTYIAIVMQTGVDDAHDASGAGLAIGLGAGIGAVSGLLAAKLTRREDS